MCGLRCAVLRCCGAVSWCCDVLWCCDTVSWCCDVLRCCDTVSWCCDVLRCCDAASWCCDVLWCCDASFCCFCRSRSCCFCSLFHISSSFHAMAKSQRKHFAHPPSRVICTLNEGSLGLLRVAEHSGQGIRKWSFLRGRLFSHRT